MPYRPNAGASPELSLRPSMRAPSELSIVVARPNLLHGFHKPPSLRAVLLLSLLTGLLFVATILPIQNYHAAVNTFGDNVRYVNAASAIRHWDFTGIQVKQFWGYPYAMALLSTLTHIPEPYSLLIVSSASLFVSVGLAYKLWGGWVAAFFTVLNFDWMQRAFLGGAEPLSVALIFGAFLAFRRDRYVLAVFLASLSTVVRPLGIFCLIGIAATLLYRREFRKLSLTVLVGALVGTLYILPFWIYFHDPLYQVHRYKTSDWQSGSAVGLPFAAIGHSFAHNQEPWTNVLLTLGWVILVVLGAAMMSKKEFRQYALQHQPEVLFALLYIAFLVTYNSSRWVGAEFPRFAIPVLPFVLVSLAKWRPDDRRVLWVLACVTPVLAAASALGIRNVIRVLHGAL